MAEVFGEEGLAELEETFKDLIKRADDMMSVLQEGADAFVADLKKLPAPRSSINKSGYTHLLDTFTSKQEKDQVLVGWGKYYGPIVEGGSVKMRARPHFKSTFKRNAAKYYKIMNDKILGGI